MKKYLVFALIVILPATTAVAQFTGPSQKGFYNSLKRYTKKAVA